MKARFALKLLAAFLAALLVMALVSGLLFGALFTRTVMDNQRQELKDRALRMADSLSGLLSGAGQGGMGGGYSALVRALTRSMDDIWVLDERLRVLSGGRMMGRSLAYDSLPPDAGRLVREVFLGQNPFSESFSDLVGAPSLTVGVPIYRGDQVAGVLLMHEPVSGMDAAARQGQRILLYSLLAALALAIPLSALLAWHVLRPVKRMERTAGRLAQGDYAARTGLTRQDELGSLARSMDELGQRLQQARAAQNEQEQLRRDFLANVAHELRTPVTVLKGSLEAFRDGVVTDGEQTASYHSQMLRETEGLERLVNDLMELAKLEHAQFALDMTDLLLEDVVADALRSAGGLARDKQLRFEARLPGAPLPFVGDYARLKQMLMVVLDNAARFSPKGGTITLRLDEGGITIQDEGPGIRPEELPHLFDRFHKARSGADRRGSGLGLAIARQIALRHGMDIQVDSAFGQGTRVRFVRQQGTGEGVPPPPPPPAPPPDAGEHKPSG